MSAPLWACNIGYFEGQHFRSVGASDLVTLKLFDPGGSCSLLLLAEQPLFSMRTAENGRGQKPVQVGRLRDKGSELSKALIRSVSTVDRHIAVTFCVHSPK